LGEADVRGLVSFVFVNNYWVLESIVP